MQGQTNSPIFSLSLSFSSSYQYFDFELSQRDPETLIKATCLLTFYYPPILLLLLSSFFLSLAWVPFPAQTAGLHY